MQVFGELSFTEVVLDAVINEVGWVRVEKAHYAGKKKVLLFQPDVLYLPDFLLPWEITQLMPHDFVIEKSLSFAPRVSRLAEVVNYLEEEKGVNGHAVHHDETVVDYVVNPLNSGQAVGILGNALHFCFTKGKPAEVTIREITNERPPVKGHGSLAPRAPVQ